MAWTSSFPCHEQLRTSSAPPSTLLKPWAGEPVPAWSWWQSCGERGWFSHFMVDLGAHRGHTSKLQLPVWLLPNLLWKLLFWSILWIESPWTQSFTGRTSVPTFADALSPVAGYAFIGPLTEAGHAVNISSCVDAFIHHVIYKSPDQRVAIVKMILFLSTSFWYSRFLKQKSQVT